MDKDEFKVYQDAVNIVCTNCTFKEETCDNCPIRKTMNIVTGEENKNG